MSSPYSGFPGEDFFHPGFTPARAPLGTLARPLTTISRKPVARTSASAAGTASAGAAEAPVSPASSVYDEAFVQSSHPSHPSPPPPPLWPGLPHVQQDYVGAQLHGERAAIGQPVSPVTTSDEGQFSTKIASRTNSLAHRVTKPDAPSRSRVNAPLPPLPQGPNSGQRNRVPQEPLLARGQQQERPLTAETSWPLGMGFFDRRSGVPGNQRPQVVPGGWRPSSGRNSAQQVTRTLQHGEARPAQGGAAPFMQYGDVSNFNHAPVAKEYGGNSDKFSGHSGSTSLTAPVWGGYRASWLPEILWCITSIALLAVIGVLLRLFDQQSLARWPLPITLNVLIAFLTTLCHAALVFPVVEGLSQLRWNWFAMRDRPLADFQAFEDATRGPFGSVKLLFTTTKGRFLSLAAAIVMVMGLVTSPLTQMAIAYPTRLSLASNSASVFRSESYPVANATALSADLDIRQKQSIQNGIFNPVGVPVAHLTPTCGSSECQWRNFSSLAVCVTTADVTSSLNVSASLRVGALPINLKLPNTTVVRNASLPNGAYLVGSASTYNLNMSSASGRGNSNSWPSANGTLSFSKQANLLATAISNFFVVYTNQTQHTQMRPSFPPTSDSEDQLVEDAVEFRAVEVLLHFCVASYTVDLANGVPRTTLTSSSAEVRSLSPSTDTDGNRPVLTLTTAADGRTTNYTVDPAYARLLTDYMRSALAGTYSAAMGTSAVGYTSASDVFGAAMFGLAGGGDSGMRQAVQNITQNVATSLTNTIRSLGVTQPGQTFETETFVSVRWGWLAVLIAQVALSAAFLAGVIWQTAALGVRVVKSSALAAMFAVSAEQKRILERDGPGLRVDCVDEGHLMAKMMASRGLRGRFGVMGASGWVLDLGVRNDNG